MSINENLRQQTRALLENGDRGLLLTLRGLDRSDRAGQAVVRYLMNLKSWPMTPESDFSATLDHLFAHHEGREAMDAQAYRDETAGMILEAFQHEMVYLPPEPRPEPKPNPGKVTRRPRMVKEQDTEGGADHHEVGGRSTQMDTSQASDRLKKVIAIQRGEG